MASGSDATLLDAGKKHQILQMEQALVRALRESKFEDALSAARTVLLLDPQNARAKAFIPLLEEKLSLETDSEDEEGEDGDAEGASSSEDEDDSEDDGSDEDSDEDDSDDDEEGGSEEEDAAGEGHQGASASVDDLAEGIDSIALSAANLKTSHLQRKRMRAELLRGLKDLKQREMAKELADSDPLLGA